MCFAGTVLNLYDETAMKQHPQLLFLVSYHLVLKVSLFWDVLTTCLLVVILHKLIHKEHFFSISHPLMCNL